MKRKKEARTLFLFLVVTTTTTTTTTTTAAALIGTTRRTAPSLVASSSTFATFQNHHRHRHHRHHHHASNSGSGVCCGSAGRDATRSRTSGKIMRGESPRSLASSSDIIVPRPSSFSPSMLWMNDDDNNNNGVGGGCDEGMGGGEEIPAGVDITIEYCSACRWMLRASWIAAELLTTFAKEETLVSVTLIPTGGGGPEQDEEEGGIFRVSATSPSLSLSSGWAALLEEGEGGKSSVNGPIVLWDRKVTGRFPESKEVKQLVRDIVNPAKNLGHSDVVGSIAIKTVLDDSQMNARGNEDVTPDVADDCIECKEREENEKKERQVQNNIPQQQHHQQHSTVAASSLPFTSQHPQHNRVTIEYSTGGSSSVDSPDNGLYLAAYYANELLSMVYARNAWWKMRKQRRLVGDGDSVGDDAVPVAVDSVAFVPNRLDCDLLVS